jgi:hypothetical protein
MFDRSRLRSSFVRRIHYGLDRTLLDPAVHLARTSLEELFRAGDALMS